MVARRNQVITWNISIVQSHQTVQKGKACQPGPGVNMHRCVFVPNDWRRSLFCFKSLLIVDLHTQRVQDFTICAHSIVTWQQFINVSI